LPKKGRFDSSPALFYDAKTGLEEYENAVMPSAGKLRSADPLPTAVAEIGFLNPAKNAGGQARQSDERC
jgi:hypothetical protein